MGRINALALIILGATVGLAAGGCMSGAGIPEGIRSTATATLPGATLSGTTRSESIASVSAQQILVEQWMRTDPKFESALGGAPHSGRFVCAYAPIVPPTPTSIYARVLCLELLGVGPGAFSMTGGRDVVALQLDGANHVVSWAVPTPGVQGDLQRFLPDRVFDVLRETSAEADGAIYQGLEARCRAIASALDAGASRTS